MKTTAKVLSLVLAASLPLCAQGTTWTSNSTTQDRYVAEPYNGYDYELWNQYKAGTATMTLTGDDGIGASAKGGTFTASWTNTCNVLFRSGKKWGINSTQNHTQIGNMTVDYAATWSSNDGAKMLGVYGWAFFTQNRIPTKRENGSNETFSKEIEYYIIQQHGSYNPATNSQWCRSTPYGEKTIDGILYEFRVCDRIGQAKLEGSGNFKQFISIPKSGPGRTSGTIDVTAHFNAWHEVGMYMDGPLYEVAMKIESYNCEDGENNPANFKGNGSGSVTKNILTIGGSGGGSSSGDGGSSSSSDPVQATTCDNFIGTLPATPNPPTDPYTACFKHTDNKCYVCKIENEGDGNTCASTWVWNGDNVDDNLALGTSGYWYQEVSCEPTRIIVNKTPLTQFSVRTSGKALLVEASSPATIIIYNLKGKKEATFNVSGSQTINLSLPSGMYFAKVHGVKTQHARFIVK